MINYLDKLFKKIEGKIIAIGLNDKKLVDTINENDKIIECNLLDCLSINEDETGKLKKIRLGKLRKKFKKNKPDYIVYNIDKIGDYKEKFVYDTVYLSTKEIYFYSESNIDIDNIIRRYKRFSLVEVINLKDGKIYKISNIKRKHELFYKIKDNILDMIDIFSNAIS